MSPAHRDADTRGQDQTPRLPLPTGVRDGGDGHPEGTVDLKAARAAELIHGVPQPQKDESLPPIRMNAQIMVFRAKSQKRRARKLRSVPTQELRGIP